MDALERRYTPGTVQVRAAGDDRRSIGGYAAVFGRLSRNLGGFVEEVTPRAFNDSRGRDWPDVVARHNHDDNLLLGTTGAGTLKLQVDSTGLMYEVTPPASRSDIVELVERGDVRHSSFAFRVVEDDWGTTDQNYPKRSLINVQLVDVASVVTPAYPDASAGLRSLAAKFDADIDEVRSMAQADELRKFFLKTGPEVAAKKQTLGAAARVHLLGNRDPWAAE